MAKAMREATKSIFDPQGIPTPQEIRWAMAVFRTRSFMLPYDGHVLVPLLDSFNHKPSRGLPAMWKEAHWNSGIVQAQGVYLATLADVEKGGEACAAAGIARDRSMMLSGIHLVWI